MKGGGRIENRGEGGRECKERAEKVKARRESNTIHHVLRCEGNGDTVTWEWAQCTMTPVTLRQGGRQTHRHGDRTPPSASVRD